MTRRLMSLLAAFALLLGGSRLSAQTLGDVTQPGDTVVGSSANIPGPNESADKAIDGNPATKYLNFDKLNTGFTVTPAAAVGPSIVRGITVVSANDAPERDPSSFKIEGSTDGGANWTLIASNAIPAFTARFQVRQVFFANDAAYTSYKVTFPTVANAGTANSMQVAEVELLGNAYTLGVIQTDVTCPLDAHTAISSNNVSTNMPAVQQARYAIDNVISGNSKYLNFDKTMTGIQITPTSGNSRVTAVSLTSGGDQPPRDPRSFTLEGSNDGGMNWTLITSNYVPNFALRLQRQVIYFNNNNDYTSYRLVFPDVTTNSLANSMQITEIELLGVAYQPGIAGITTQPVNRTVVVGDKATFSVGTTGTPAIAYQWYSNGVAIAGATAREYTTPVTTLADNSTPYWVTVSNSLGGTVSATATLSVVAPSGTAGSFVTSFTGGNTPPGDTTYNAATIAPYGGVGGSNGVLILTTAANSLYGQYYVNDLAGGTPVNYFKMSSRLAMGGGTARPADGMAFFFGNDLNQAPTTEGEEGTGTGLVVSLDTWDNNGTDNGPGFRVKYGGAVIASQSMMTNYNNTGTTLTPLREGGRAPAGPILTDSNCTPVNIFTWGQSSIAPNDGSFVPFTVELFPDNTLSVTYSNVVVFDHIALPYTPLVNPQFGFSARTGGANAAHMIDDLQIYVNYAPGAAAITTPPSNVTTNEGNKAVFEVAVSGAPPVSVQWYSNNVAIPGANFFTYVTPITTTNMSGTVYRVDVSNSANSAPVSASATLTVLPALKLVSATSSNTANTVYVTFNKALGNIGTYSLNNGATVNTVTPGPNTNQVTLSVSPLTLDVTYTLTISGATAADGSLLFPSPTTVGIRYGFGAICYDFNDDLQPAGTFLQRDAIAQFARISNGFVHLTDANVGGGGGSFYITNKMQGAPLDRLQARWRSYVGDGQNGGADGYSFNWAPDLAATGIPAEEGSGTGLSVTIDTWDNGGTDHGPGIQIKWKGAEVAYMLRSKVQGAADSVRKGAWVDASVEVLPNGQATFNYDGFVITAQLAGFTPVVNWNFQFGGRTGGANDNQWIDDLQINCFPIGAPIFSRQPTSTNVIEGDPATFSVAVQGAPPLGAPQWYTNGVAMTGAVGTSVTIPGTAANNGLQLSAVVCNDFGCTTSQVATLTVTLAPRLVRAYMGCSPDVIFVVWNKPVLGSGTYVVDATTVNFVQVNPNDPTMVLLYIDPVGFGPVNITSITGETDTGSNPQYPASTSASTSYGLMSFFADFNDNLVPPGVTLSGNAARVADGVLHLTDAVNDQCGSIFIPDLNNGANVQLMHASFDFLLGGSPTAGADGFSFNWANNITAASACPSAIEEGIGSGLSVTVDTFDNGCSDCSTGTDTGVEVKWAGQRIAYYHINKNNNGSGVYLRKNSFVPVNVNVFETGLVQLDYAGISIQGQIPNYKGIAGGNFVLAARTGGANDNHWVDNLFIGGVIPDTNGPVIYTPFTVETNVVGNSQVVDYVVTARDLCEGPANVTCNPPSGSTFPVGLTTVTCTSVDSENNMSTASFPVIVNDLSRPTIISNTKTNIGGTNGFLVKFTARSGQTYTVEAAPELPISGAPAWSAIGTATDLGSGQFEFFDSSAILSSRFYRIRYP